MRLRSVSRSCLSDLISARASARSVERLALLTAVAGRRARA